MCSENIKKEQCKAEKLNGWLVFWAGIISVSVSAIIAGADIYITNKNNKAEREILMIIRKKKGFKKTRKS